MKSAMIICSHANGLYLASSGVLCGEMCGSIGVRNASIIQIDRTNSNDEVLPLDDAHSVSA